MEKEMEIDIELFEKCRSSIPLPLPPRLEDAGLEDCALSTEGIREAFLKAAQAVKSTASTILHKDDEEMQDGGDCIEGDGPSNGEWTDSVQDFSYTPNNSGRGQSCVGSLVGGLVEEGSDKLVGIGLDNVEGDQIVDGGKPGKHLGEDGVCVPDLNGVPGSRVDKDENGKEEEEEEGPILAETYV